MNFKSKCFLILLCLAGLNLNAMHMGRIYRTVLNTARNIKKQNWNRASSFASSANTAKNTVINQAKSKWTTAEKLAAATLGCYTLSTAFMFYQIDQNTKALEVEKHKIREQRKKDKLEYHQLLDTLSPEFPKIIKIRQFEYIIEIDSNPEQYNDFPSFKISVLDDNNDEVAYMTYGIYPNCWISSLHIDPEFRKKGIGTNLLKLAIPEIQAIKNNEDIKLDVYESCFKYTTVDFYLKRGAKIKDSEDLGPIMEYNMIFPKDINIDKATQND